MPGIFVHNFQYMGMLAAFLMIVGIVFSRNKFKIPIVFGVIFYFLFCSVNRFPLFWSALQLDVPMTRHFLFTHLHLSPLLALLAGMGMDHILEKGDNSTQLKPSFKIKTSYLAFFFSISILSYLLIKYATLENINNSVISEFAGLTLETPYIFLALLAI